jgi:ubiquinol-cytochrome c reductase iron-sulfur subunit
VASKTAEPSRRDFMIVSAGAFAAVGAAAALWPFVDQMNPDASALSLASIQVDIAPIEEGQAITVMWRGKPVFIRHRTPEEIEQARAVDVSELPDPQARNENIEAGAPATDLNRVAAGEGEAAEHEKWIVMVGICTHLGCIPKGQKVGDEKGDFGGWFCPCHGSHYDTAGRVRTGPAPHNLEVPPFAFLSETTIQLG